MLKYFAFILVLSSSYAPDPNHELRYIDEDSYPEEVSSSPQQKWLSEFAYLPQLRRQSSTLEPSRTDVTPLTAPHTASRTHSAADVPMTAVLDAVKDIVEEQTRKTLHTIVESNEIVTTIIVPTTQETELTNIPAETLENYSTTDLEIATIPTTPETLPTTVTTEGTETSDFDTTTDLFDLTTFTDTDEIIENTSTVFRDRAESDSTFDIMETTSTDFQFDVQGKETDTTYNDYTTDELLSDTTATDIESTEDIDSGEVKDSSNVTMTNDFYIDASLSTDLTIGQRRQFTEHKWTSVKKSNYDKGKSNTSISKRKLKATAHPRRQLWWPFGGRTTPAPLLETEPQDTQKQTETRRTRKTRRRRTKRSQTTLPRIDFAKLMLLVSNLTLTYEDELLSLLNKSLQKYIAATCPTPQIITTTELSTTDMYANLTGTIMGKCFVCGMYEPDIPRTADCADAFAGDFIPLLPVNAQARGKVAKFRKYCRWMNIPRHYYNASDPRSMWGRWTGGCAVRWIDVSGIYTQRTCRNRHRATMGRHWISKRMAKLEMALQHVDNGCMVSPVASLVPFSRGISLYARFHVCVCTGNWCNRATRSQQWTAYIVVWSFVLWRICCKVLDFSS